MSLSVTIADVEVAAGRLADQFPLTPLVRLPQEGAVFAKCENLQRTGTFKFRGAYNKASSLDPEVRARGLVTDSSGNHGQAVAYVASLFRVPAVVAMPSNAIQFKVERTRRWGAELVWTGEGSQERTRVARQIAADRGATHIPPFDDELVVAGQGTIGLELAAQLPELEQVVVPVGGGGLISGIALAVKAKLRGVRVIGVEPELAADAKASLESGQRVTWSAEDVVRTVADGARTQAIGELNFTLMRELVDEIVTVPEAAILQAMGWLAIEAKLAVEPTGALALAGVQTGAVRGSGPLAVILSGGNYAPAQMAQVLLEMT